MVFVLNLLVHYSIITLFVNIAAIFHSCYAYGETKTIRQIRPGGLSTFETKVTVIAIVLRGFM